MGLDTRKIPTEKELKKMMKEYTEIRYTWKDKDVLKVKKKGEKAEIEIKEGRKIVKMSELKKTSEFQDFSDAHDALQKYVKKQDIKVVRDHCHFEGKFRGAAHNHCNRLFRKTYSFLGP